MAKPSLVIATVIVAIIAVFFGGFIYEIIGGLAFIAFKVTVVLALIYFCIKGLLFLLIEPVKGDGIKKTNKD